MKPKYLTKDGDNVRIDQHLIDTLIIPFVYFDEDTRKLSVRFAFTAACLARWFCTIGEAGVVLYPDSEPEDIARAINAAILSADLPMFTITPHDFLLPDELTLYDEDENGERTATSDTGTFFDHISIGHRAGGAIGVQNPGRRGTGHSGGSIAKTTMSQSDTLVPA